MDSPTKITIYILGLQVGKYYIGKSYHPEKRIDQHFNGTGSAWTKKYPPISIVDVISDCDLFDEDKYTKMYMAQYGIDNVRGGSYCQIRLTDEMKRVLENELRASENKCYHCGEGGHFVSNCPNKGNSRKKGRSSFKTCRRCKRKGHLVSKCYAKTTQSGELIGQIKICSKCRRTGHSVFECYAKKDVDGNPIT